MVDLQELSPHTMPLFVSAVRLLPAGLALIAWAAASGRPQPKTGAAWLAISVFGLADATCFQASSNWKRLLLALAVAPTLEKWNQASGQLLVLTVRALTGLPGRRPAAHSSRAGQRHHRLAAAVGGSLGSHILWREADTRRSRRAAGGRRWAVPAGAAARGTPLPAPDLAGWVLLAS